MSGLKFASYGKGYEKDYVSPFAGEWIEIKDWEGYPWCKPSHPSRVSGLKFNQIEGIGTEATSHPSRVSGLKSHLAEPYSEPLRSLTLRG